jgi:hypothetical protein
MATTTETVSGSVELSVDEQRELFDRLAHTRMGMSGDEFIKRFDAGEFDDSHRAEVIELVILLPFVR